MLAIFDTCSVRAFSCRNSTFKTNQNSRRFFYRISPSKYFQLNRHGPWPNGHRGCVNFTPSVTWTSKTAGTAENGAKMLVGFCVIAFLEISFPIPNKIFGKLQILLMEENPANHLWCINLEKIIGMNYQPQLVSQISEPSNGSSSVEIAPKMSLPRQYLGHVFLGKFLAKNYDVTL